MLQEKVSAVTDGCMSRVQDNVQPDLLSEEPRLDLSTAPTIPSASEPNQVRLLLLTRECPYLEDFENAAHFSENLGFD